MQIIGLMTEGQNLIMSIITRIKVNIILLLVSVCVICFWFFLSKFSSHNLIETLEQVSWVDIPSDYSIVSDTSEESRFGSDGFRIVEISSDKFLQDSVQCKFEGYSLYKPEINLSLPHWSRTLIGNKIDWSQSVCYKVVSRETSSILAINTNRMIYSFIY